MKKQLDVLYVSNNKIQKAISKPIPKKIIDCFYDTPLTASQIADAVSFPKDKIYYHIKKLIALDILFVWGTLKIFNHSKRFFQTATALFGVLALLGVIRIPVLVWIEAVREVGNEPTTGVFVYLALFLWTIDVAGFILAKATQNKYFVGVLISTGYVMVSFSLRDYMFPVTG